MAIPLAMALLGAAASSTASAQEAPQDAFVIDVNAAVVTGAVSIDGAVLGPATDVGGYWFSDGSDVTLIEIDTTATATSTSTDVPLLTLMNIVGTASGDGIEVSSWAPLDIMTPAVIRTPEEARQAFQAWIIVQNSQAPAE